MKQIRLGIIGCGGMEKSHEKGIEGLEDSVRITAVCDIVEERAEKAKELLKADMAVTDYKEMFPFVDAVLVVLPHHLHHPVGMACLEAGKHVLMEKPLAITESECLDLVHLADEKQLVLMIGYVMRYNPLVVKAKELVESGAIGDPFQMSIWTEQFTRFPDDRLWGHKIATLGAGSSSVTDATMLICFCGFSGARFADSTSAPTAGLRGWRRKALATSCWNSRMASPLIISERGARADPA